MKLQDYIRVVPNWPKAGVSFKDITPLLRDALAFRAAIHKLIQPYVHQNIASVVGIDARGFLFAGAMAYALKCGAVLVRKKGKLPWDIITQSYALEYGTAVLEIHKDAIKKSARVAVVDDILATGGTMLATTKLVEKLGGKVVGVSVLGVLDFSPGAQRVAKKYALHSLISFTS